MGRTLHYGVQPGHTRNYLYPVYTPAGQAVTDETPVDHPHHRSIWIAAEEVSGYNFYIERAYGGRTAGAIREIDAAWEQLAADKLRVVQTLEWRGAPDWSDPDGRLMLVETRTTDIQPGDVSNLLTIRSQLVPGGGPSAPAGRLADGTPLPGKPVAGSAKSPGSVTIGPTKHSYYGVRLADRLHVTHDGVIKDSEGRTNEAEIFDQAADWVDAHGPMAFDKIAGVGVLARCLVRRRPLVRPRLRLALHQHHAHASRRHHRRAALGPDRPLRHPRRRPQRRRHRRRVPALPRRGVGLSHSREGAGLAARRLSHAQ